MKKISITIDSAGRIVLPKAVRESLGIVGRSRVTLEVFGGKAELSVSGTEAAAVRRRNGRVVSSAPLPADWDSGEAVARMRHQRLER